MVVCAILKTIDGAAEKSKISSISTNAAGFCVKKPWNPQRIPRLFALHPACVCEISVIFFVFRYTLAKHFALGAYLALKSFEDII